MWEDNKHLEREAKRELREADYISSYELDEHELQVNHLKQWIRDHLEISPDLSDWIVEATKDTVLEDSEVQRMISQIVKARRLQSTPKAEDLCWDLIGHIWESDRSTKLELLKQELKKDWPTTK